MSGSAHVNRHPSHGFRWGVNLAEGVSVNRLWQMCYEGPCGSGPSA